jgi:histidinol-phosphatase
MGRRWWAVQGGGAWTREVNGDVNQIHVSGVANLVDASFSFSDAVDWDRHSTTHGTLQRFVDATWRQRAYGDFLSHMLVAEGAVDISAEPTLAAWDMAALIPIIEEAGGRATGFPGGDPLVQTSLVCTNRLLHDHALGLILQ